MKKKKQKHSLTSAQRKELKRKQAPKGDAIVHHNTEGGAFSTDDQAVAFEAQASQNKKRQKYIIKIVAICAAVVLALGSIATGVVLGINNANRWDNFGLNDTPVNPVATISLSNGEQIEIELFFAYSPAIVANFIYLAHSGFFDNTLFHNNQRGFVAFSGFTSITPAVFGAQGVVTTPTVATHRAEDRDFVSTLTGFASERSAIYGNSSFKLGYRLEPNAPSLPHITRPRNPNQMPFTGPDTTSRNYTPRGYFAMMASNHDTAGSSTSFVMIHCNYNVPTLTASRRNNAGDASLATFQMSARRPLSAGTTAIDSLAYIGRMTNESIAVVEGIARRGATRFAPNAYRQNWLNNFYHLTEADSIYIVNIRFSRLDRRLRNRIMHEFEDFVLGARDELENPDALGGLAGWRHSEQSGWPDQRLLR